MWQEPWTSPTTLIFIAPRPFPLLQGRTSGDSHVLQHLHNDRSEVQACPHFHHVHLEPRRHEETARQCPKLSNRPLKVSGHSAINQNELAVIKTMVDVRVQASKCVVISYTAYSKPTYNPTSQTGCTPSWTAMRRSHSLCPQNLQLHGFQDRHLTIQDKHLDIQYPKISHA